MEAPSQLGEPIVVHPAAVYLREQQQARVPEFGASMLQLWGGPPLPPPAAAYALPGERLESAHARHAARSAALGGLRAAVGELLDGAYAEALAQVRAAVLAPPPACGLLPTVLLCSPGTVADAELVMPKLTRHLRRRCVRAASMRAGRRRRRGRRGLPTSQRPSCVWAHH